MRFAFVDRTSLQITPQAKGELFERFCRRVLGEVGYTDLSLRLRRNSAEIDVTGTHLVTKLPLLAEAKAYEHTVPLHDLAAFGGKAVPAGRKGHLDAVFLSLTALTGEARDYLDAAQQPGGLGQVNLQTYIADELYDLLVDRSSYPPESLIRQRIESEGAVCFEVFLVITRDADILLATTGPTPIGAATAFRVFNSIGRELPVPDEFAEQLRSQIPDLQDLRAGVPASGDAPDERALLPTIASGNGWFDYKFPSDPAYFVGRIDALEVVRETIQSSSAGDTALRALQLVSRSGVGKSSTLLKIAQDQQDLRF